MLINGIRILLDNLLTCLKYVEGDNVSHGLNEFYYHFNDNVCIKNKRDDIHFWRESLNYEHDSLVICTDEFDEEQLWIALNDDSTGLTIFPRIRNEHFNSLVINTTSLILRINHQNDIIYDIPITSDEYFNITLLYDIPYSLEEFVEIHSFLVENKKIMKQYSVMLEVS